MTRCLVIAHVTLHTFSAPLHMLQVEDVSDSDSAREGPPSAAARPAATAAASHAPQAKPAHRIAKPAAKQPWYFEGSSSSAEGSDDELRDMVQKVLTAPPLKFTCAPTWLVGPAPWFQGASDDGTQVMYPYRSKSTTVGGWSLGAFHSVWTTTKLHGMCCWGVEHIATCWKQRWRHALM
jgi:hypothetical protein